MQRVIPFTSLVNFNEAYRQSRLEVRWFFEDSMRVVRCRFFVLELDGSRVPQVTVCEL